MGHHTKDKANVATAKALLDLTVKEYEVLTPFSDHLPFDLAAYKDGKFFKIQVKYSVDGMVHGQTSWTDRTGTHHRKYTQGMFDYYAMYLPAVDVVVYPAFRFAGRVIATEPRRTGMSF